MKNQSLAVVAVVGAAALFGLTGTVAALGSDDLAPFVAGVWRSVIGGLCLVGLAAVKGTPITAYSLRNPWILAGGLGVAAYQLAFFEAVDRTGVALGTLVTIGAGPPVAGLLDWFANGRRPAASWFAGSVLAIAGVALLSGGSEQVDALGILFALIAGMSFPLFGSACQRLMNDRPFLPAMATVFGAGLVLLLPIAVFTAEEVMTDSAALLSVIILGVATLALAYVLWGIGLRSLSLSIVVTATLIEPAVAATLAVIVLDEPATVALAVGLGLVAVGVLISSLPGRVTTAASRA